MPVIPASRRYAQFRSSTRQASGLESGPFSRLRPAHRQSAYQVLDMKPGILLALAAILASGPSLATSFDPDQIDSVIKNLDLTSFPNSIGPRRMARKTTFAEYGFVHVKKIAHGADLVEMGKGWMMSFKILSSTPKSLRLCFHDRGLAASGDSRAPSYNATSALLVLNSPRGMWTAKQIPAGFADCQNNPPAG